MPGPKSRHRTDSIHSVSTQPADLQSYGGDPTAFPMQQWPSNDRAPAMQSMQLTSDEMLMRLQSQSHMQSSREFSMETSMSGSVGPAASFAGHHSMGQPSQMIPDGMQSLDHSFVDRDSQIMERDGNEDGDSTIGAGPKTSRSSQSNDHEMRQLFQQNKGRQLEEVAAELHGNERGPHSERTRQVFAMLWIDRVCAWGKGSVPRGRVYTAYAERCDRERITVLNPASFGKLVRVLFRGLKTRRLGVRGESKYHYVDFKLTEELPEPAKTQPLDSLSNFNTAPSRSVSVHAEQSVLPSPDLRPEPKSPQSPRTRRRLQKQRYRHAMYNQATASTLNELNTVTPNNATAKTGIIWSLGPDADVGNPSDPVALPPLEPFLPSGTDSDAARCLVALYRSHCTSLIENIRFCKDKAFFHLFESFQGTLTMPVQKLFGHPAVAAWIEQCDFVLYQKMTRFVANLALQVLPAPVLGALRRISEELVPRIRKAFQGQPAHVIRAKEAPAALFAGLLDRMLRVNLTAHAACNMLANPFNRDQMFTELVTLVRLRKVCEMLPTRAMDDVVKLIATEIWDLVDPVDVPAELPTDWPLPSARPPRDAVDADANAVVVLDRWTAFLQSLPVRFPYASQTEILWCINALSSSMLRDITMLSGKSFGAWWVTKCWIDEMAAFLAEKGGFLKMKSSQCASPPAVVPAPVAASAPNTSQQHVPSGHVQQESNHHASRDLSLSSHLGSQQHQSQVHSYSISQPDRAPFPTDVASTASRSTSGELNNRVDTAAVVAAQAMLNTSNHDDSGIGIRTPDDEFSIVKFDYLSSEEQSNGLLNGSTDVHVH